MNAHNGFLARWAFAVALCMSMLNSAVAAQVSASDAALHRASVIRAHAELLNALKSRTHAVAKRLVVFGSESPRSEDAIFSGYIKVNDDLESVGIKLISREVRAVELFHAPQGVVAFLRLTSVHSHPVPDIGEVRTKHSLVGFSLDGLEWRFAVSNCFREDHLRDLFPGDAGTPSFHEE